VRSRRMGRQPGLRGVRDGCGTVHAAPWCGGHRSVRVRAWPIEMCRGAPAARRVWSALVRRMAERGLVARGGAGVCCRLTLLAIAPLSGRSGTLATLGPVRAYVRLLCTNALAPPKKRSLSRAYAARMGAPIAACTGLAMCYLVPSRADFDLCSAACMGCAAQRAAHNARQAKPLSLT
jgi:hypothetical protein